MKDIKKDILKRVYLIYFGVLLFGLVILARILFVQYGEGKALRELARSQEIREFNVEAVRGNICSDDGTLLATSIPIFDIRWDVCTDSITDERFRKNVDSLAICVYSLFRDKKVSEYRDMFWEARRTGERYLLIQRDVTYPQLKKLRTFPLFRMGKYKGGLIAIPQYQRELPFRNLAKRTIGYESEDAANKVYVGLEGAFSKNLQGTNGKCLMKRMGGAAWMPMDPDNQVEPQNGEDIITTLDINLQDLAETELYNQLKEDSADHGCVVVMEVKSGYVKAIANLGRTKTGDYEELLNYAIYESSEPGSTFKLASFLVALEDGKIELNTPVNTGNGQVVYYGRTMEDSHKGYGTITAQQVFEKSSNVGTSKMIFNAYSSNPQKYIDGLYRLGIQRPLKLQLTGEGRPYIKNTKSRYWSAVSLPWMSIGYEVALTPIQLLTLYNAIANNGVMVKPLFVKEIRKNGQVAQSFPPVVINPQTCSPATLQKIKILLEGVVIRGTGAGIQSPLSRIAGKTGTAQLAYNNRGYKQDTKQVRYKGSFVGYFPADNPKYSIIVVINNPTRGKYYGALVAAPVFRAISDRLYASDKEIQYQPKRDTLFIPVPFALTGYQKDLEEVYKTLDIKVRTVNNYLPIGKPYYEGNSVTLMPQGVAKGTMPDVKGMGLRDALYLLEEQGLKVQVTGTGSVVDQSVAPGNLVTKGTMVALSLGKKTAN